MLLGLWASGCVDKAPPPLWPAPPPPTMATPLKAEDGAAASESILDPGGPAADEAAPASGASTSRASFHHKN